MLADNSGGSSAGILILIIVLGIWLSDWVPFRSDYSVYEIKCLDEGLVPTCAPKKQVAGDKTNYRPDSATQSVIYWREGQAPMKFENCAIVDVKNWSCSYRKMVDGALDGETEFTGFPRQVSKFEWWWLRFKHIGE